MSEIREAVRERYASKARSFSGESAEAASGCCGPDCCSPASTEEPVSCGLEYEAGELASDGPAKSDRRAYEAKIAGLERKVGQLTMELDLLKKGLISARRASGGTSSVVSGPKAAASEPGAAS